MQVAFKAYQYPPPEKSNLPKVPKENISQGLHYAGVVGLKFVLTFFPVFGKGFISGVFSR